MSDELMDGEVDETEWGLGAYPSAVVKEPDMTRTIRLAESRKAAEKLWLAVQKELRRAD